MTTTHHLETGGEKLELTADLAGDGGMVSLNGRARQISFQSLQPGWMQLEVDKQINQVYILDTPTGKQVFINGQTCLVTDGKRVPGRRRFAAGGDGPSMVTPPMPAKVVRIMVQVGEHVEEGQGLMIVSAMKMEATLAAPHAGTIINIHTELDDKVMPGQELVEISREKNDDP